MAKEGDYYLTEKEKEDIGTLCSECENVIVILNSFRIHISILMAERFCIGEVLKFFRPCIGQFSAWGNMASYAVIF